MSNTSTRSVNESAYDLFDRWMAHREQENAAVAGHRTGNDPEVSPEPDVAPPAEEVAAEVTAQVIDEAVEEHEVVETEEDFEEFAHPAPALGGVAAAPPSLGPEPTGEAGPSLPAPAPSPVTVGASAPPHPPRAVPTAAPVPGLVLFSPRRGFRHVLTGVAALLAAGTGIAGYLARQSPTPTTIGAAAGLLAVLVLTWKLRSRTTGTQVTIEHGVLRIVQGDSRHQFPLVGTHPPIDVVGEPGQRSWRVLIQRRGMAPFVITRAMVDPADFTEALRHFRPLA